jgi:membrane protein implicated in regulation of membrane protease activity
MIRFDDLMVFVVVVVIVVVFLLIVRSFIKRAENPPQDSQPARVKNEEP